MVADSSHLITKSSVCLLLKQAFIKSFTRTNVVSGFESTGIAPWNPTSIPKEAFVPSTATATATTTSSGHLLSWVMKQVKSGDNSSVVSAHVSSAVASETATSPVSGNAATSANPDEDEGVAHAVQVPCELSTVAVAGDVPLAEAGTSQPCVLANHLIGPCDIPTQVTKSSPIEVVFPDGKSQFIQPELASAVEVSGWMQDISDIFGVSKSETAELKPKS
jgi:hypothetical protein